jgi:hypothetical protein
MNKSKVEDIQVRLGVVITLDNGPTCQVMTTWYGPQDLMRFAVVKKTDRELKPGEREIVEKKAKTIFAEKIRQLEECLKSAI